MTTGAVVVTFSEIMNASSTVLSRFQIASTNGSDPIVSAGLAGEVTSEDGLVLEFTLTSQLI